ncbi:MAG: hypothetical protein GF311_21625 [Candidatus Lokiarchaeota archaeon]|nr:hypothetical protein [Candidatus Lokiarchaeota archaeon]
MNYTDFLDEDLDLSSSGKKDVMTQNTRKNTSISVEILLTIIEILRKLGGKPNKKISITKMCDKLHIPVQDRKKYIQVLFECQDLFLDIYKSHSIILKKERNKLYFTEKIPSYPKTYIERSSPHENVPNQIELSQVDLSVLNDLIFLFTNVRRGKGFNLGDTDSDLMKGLKQLRREHPYLFFSNGHGLVYPTEFTIDLTQKVRSYLKCNRSFETLQIKDCKIIKKIH